MASSSSSTGGTPPPLKRKRASERSDETSDSPNRLGSSPDSRGRSSSEWKIPIDISSWRGEHIQSLSIVIEYDEKNTKTFALLKNCIHDYTADMSPSQCKTFREKQDLLYKFEIFFLKKSQFHENLDEEFASLSRSRGSSLRETSNYSTKRFNARYLKGLEQFDRSYLLEWRRRFEVAGVRFADCLYFTVIRRDLDIIDDDDDRTRKQPLTEYDFQFLFEAFTSMFNLQSFNWNAPLLRSKTLDLPQSKAAGKTDIIYYQDIDEEIPQGQWNMMKNIVAICKVKKYDKEPQQLDRMATRKHESSGVPSSSSSTQKPLPPHMSLAELGQLGGELLLYSQQSFAKDVIFGIFVQETKVSFAALKITPAEYNGILSGKLEKTNPKLIITRPFDYMKKEDRKHLIKPLLQLSMIQEEICDQKQK